MADVFDAGAAAGAAAGADANAMARLRTEAAEARLISGGVVTLTEAARRSGTEGVVTTLARLLGGWAAVIDRYGQPVAVVGGARIHIDDAISLSMNRTRRVRHPNLEVYPIGPEGDPRAHLVISSRLGLTSRVRELASQARALLELTYRPQRGGELERLARQDVVDVLLSDHAGLAAQIAARWGMANAQLVVALVRSRSRAVILETVVLEWLDELQLPAAVGVDGSRVTVVLAPEAVAAWVERVQHAANREAVPVRCGIGRPAPLGSLRASALQAQQSLEVAISESISTVLFDELSSVDVMLKALSPAAIATMVEPVRALLDLPADLALFDSLRIFLVENGSWEAAASQLGIHRHTLRNRIQKIEDLTGLSMSSAEDRFRAWIAIRALSMTPGPQPDRQR